MVEPAKKSANKKKTNIQGTQWRCGGALGNVEGQGSGILGWWWFAMVEVPHSLCKWFGIWVFPKIGGTPPKWRVYNKWKTLLFNGWFGGKTTIFGNIHLMVMVYRSIRNKITKQQQIQAYLVGGRTNPTEKYYCSQIGNLPPIFGVNM